jgi:hypothetical protein
MRKDLFYSPRVKPQREWLKRVVDVGQEQSRTVVQDWAQWLGAYPWQAWGTLTFADGAFSSDAAGRAWNRYAAWLKVQYPLRTYFVGHEVGARGRLHLHCLLGVLSREENDRAAFSHCWKWWFDRYGRAEVKGYDPQRGAAAYVSKYVTKALAHYDLDLDGFTCLSVPREKSSKPGPTWIRTRGSGG